MTAADLILIGGVMFDPEDVSAVTKNGDGVTIILKKGHDLYIKDVTVEQIAKEINKIVLTNVAAP